MGNLAQFTVDSIAATRAAWLAKANELDIPTLDYEMVLEWAESHMSYDAANGDSFAYGIFPEGNNEAVAIVDIVYTQRPGPTKGWLKMLSVKLSPNFAPSELETAPQKLIQVLDIYSDATIGTIVLTGRHTAKIVKLFGRNESLLKLLVALNERLSAKTDGLFSTKMEGRWLVVSAL